MGAPPIPSTRRSRAAEELGYPVVIKAQVLIGGPRQGRAASSSPNDRQEGARGTADAILGMDHIRGFAVHEACTSRRRRTSPRSTTRRSSFDQLRRAPPMVMLLSRHGRHGRGGDRRGGIRTRSCESTWTRCWAFQDLPRPAARVRVPASPEDVVPAGRARLLAQLVRDVRRGGTRWLVEVQHRLLVDRRAQGGWRSTRRSPSTAKRPCTGIRTPARACATSSAEDPAGAGWPRSAGPHVREARRPNIGILGNGAGAGDVHRLDVVAQGRAVARRELPRRGRRVERQDAGS